jgi:hypothetical protein
MFMYNSLIGLRVERKKRDIGEEEKRRDLQAHYGIMGIVSTVPLGRLQPIAAAAIRVVSCRSPRAAADP